MRISPQAMKEIDSAVDAYREEIENAVKTKNLKRNTADTYFPHVEQFVRWLKGDFEPGGRTKNRL